MHAPSGFSLYESHLWPDLWVRPFFYVSGRWAVSMPLTVRIGIAFAMASCYKSPDFCDSGNRGSPWRMIRLALPALPPPIYCGRLCLAQGQLAAQAGPVVPLRHRQRRAVRRWRRIVPPWPPRWFRGVPVSGCCRPIFRWINWITRPGAVPISTCWSNSAVIHAPSPRPYPEDDSGWR